MKPTAVEQPVAVRVRFVSGRSRVFPLSASQFEAAISHSIENGVHLLKVPHIRGATVIQIGSIETFEPAISGDKDTEPNERNTDA